MTPNVVRRLFPRVCKGRGGLAAHGDAIDDGGRER